jgi:uncharacterized OB-fold protein
MPARVSTSEIKRAATGAPRYCPIVIDTGQVRAAAPARTTGIRGKHMKRSAPPLTERTGDYWRSGADGTLRIARCHTCSWYIHPPQQICPKCRSRDVAFEPVSGKGKVYAYTINRYQWNPDMPPPFVIAQVELDEQEKLLVTTNVIGCEPEEVKVGTRVSVTFDHEGDVWIPVFTA